MTNSTDVILSQPRKSLPEHEKLAGKILAGLSHRPGVHVTVIPHLYDLSPDGPGVEHLRSVEGSMIVLGWLYPRAAYWVLKANDVEGRLGRTSSLPEEDSDEPSGDAPERTIWCFDLRTHEQPEAYLEEIEGIIAAVGEGAEEAATGNGKSQAVEEATRSRWYPVIDFGRCTNCLECLNFCLFGVYGLDPNDSILIEQPDACRAGCPACSRICPEGAIMFPQHKDPAIAGDPKASLEGLKLDLSQLFAGADPAELAARERDRALAEQQRHAEGTADDDSHARDGLDDLVDELDDMDL